MLVIANDEAGVIDNITLVVPTVHPATSLTGQFRMLLTTLQAAVTGRTRNSKTPCAWTANANRTAEHTIPPCVLSNGTRAEPV
jgi:hypothetical protein